MEFKNIENKWYIVTMKKAKGMHSVHHVYGLGVMKVHPYD